MEARLESYRPQMLSVLRILFGLLYLCHGLPKVFNYPIAGPPNFQILSLLGAAAVIEIVGSTLLTVGLFTRLAAFVMSGEMAVAYWFVTRRPTVSFIPIVNKGELEVIFCFVFLYFVFAGAGPWSLDALLRKKA